MKIVAEFNSIQEIKDFAELIGQKELVLKADYIKPEMIEEFKETVKEETTKEEVAPEESTPEKEEPKVEETTKEEAVPATEEVAPEKQESKKISKEDVRGIFSKLIQAGKQKQAKELTNKYGAKKIPEIKEEDYAAIYKEAEELL